MDNNVKKGFDMTVKSLKRKYNFVIGWKPSRDFDLMNIIHHSSISFIDIIIDYDKVSDYFGVPIRPYAKQRFIERDPEYIGSTAYSLDAYLTSPIGWKVPYNTKKDMEKWCEFFYKQIPQEYQRTYLFVSKFTDDQIYIKTSTFKINNFIVDYKPST